MRVKRSSTLLLLLDGDRFVFHNYLSQQIFSANPTALEIIRQLEAWTDLEDLVAALPGYSRASILNSIQKLGDAGAIVVEHSEADAKQAEYMRTWRWGPLAAAYHFGSKAGSFISSEAAEALLRERVKDLPSPPLYTMNANPGSDIRLPVRREYPEPFQTMARRRTNRIMLDRPITLSQVSDCLLFSMAITTMIEDPTVVDLPLKMTPSGGARNPYEAYVCARNVSGLFPGAYHYSAMERSLGLVNGKMPPPFPDMLGDQDWTTPASAVVFLVANFERPMWKYDHPSAYRVTLMEAGHIAQNMMLVATNLGIVANPTGALSLDIVEKVLNVGGVTQSVIYALVLGVPNPTSNGAGA